MKNNDLIKNQRRTIFGTVSSKLKGAMDTLTSKNKLTKKDVEQAMDEVRSALIQADVALPVVKKFVDEITEEAIGEKVARGEELPKAATVFAIVKDKLTQVLGNEEININISSEGINSILLVGIQGSGKTTTCAKLARRLSTLDKKKVLLVSLDVQRPAAQEQLERLSQKAEIDFLPIIQGETPTDIVHRAQQHAKDGGYDAVIYDSAGRMHINKELMEEIDQVHNLVKPNETLLVADAMLGNDAVNISQKFHDHVGVDGIVLTRVDGDARGGAAISMREVTGVPIKYIGTGEHLAELDRFVPSSMAGRILGEGDLGALAERAKQVMSEEESKKLAEGMFSGNATLFDYEKYLSSLSNIGGLSKIMSYIPGMDGSMGERVQSLVEGKFTPKDREQQLAILKQLSDQDKSNPKLLSRSGAKKKAVAQAAGVQIVAVNRMLKQYQEFTSMGVQMRDIMGGGFSMSNVRKVAKMFGMGPKTVRKRK